MGQISIEFEKTQFVDTSYGRSVPFWGEDIVFIYCTICGSWDTGGHKPVLGDQDAAGCLLGASFFLGMIFLPLGIPVLLWGLLTPSTSSIPANWPIFKCRNCGAEWEGIYGQDGIVGYKYTSAQIPPDVRAKAHRRHDGNYNAGDYEYYKAGTGPTINGR